MPDIFSRDPVTLAQILANPSQYFSHFDRDNAGVRTSHHLGADVLLSLAEVRVSSLAALRAINQPVPLVWAKGYAADGDGGGGAFRYLGSGANPADIASGGDDDDGMHVVSAGGHIWGRVTYSFVTPQMFGAQSVSTVEDANVAANQLPAVQRALDFWSNPRSFGGWDFRTQLTEYANPTVDFDMPPGLYRCEGTVSVYYQRGAFSPYTEQNVQGHITMRGSVFTPHDTPIRGIVVDASRDGGKVPILLRAVKGRANGASRPEWTYYDYPKIFENEPCPHRAWIASRKVYRYEFIQYQLADGRKYVYRCEGTGLLGVSAPTHSAGSVANGEVTLKCMGPFTNTQGKGKNDYLIDVQDWGIHIDRMWEHQSITCYSDGYMVGVACVPMLSSGSAIGWAHIHCPQLFSTHVGLMAASYTAHREVANEAARLALTLLPVGARVSQLDAVTDFIFNGPAGQESNSLNWSAAAGAPFRDGPNWTNENYFYLTSIVPIGVPSTDSGYGYVGTSFGTPHPVTHNVIYELSYEFGGQTADANESYQCVFINASEHEVHCRNDSTSTTGVVKAPPHENPYNESNANLVLAARTGERTNNVTWYRDISNGRGNHSMEAPWMLRTNDELRVDLLKDLTFSGVDKVCSRSLSFLRYSATSFTKDVLYDTTASTYSTRFNPDDRTWEFDIYNPIGVMLDLRQNYTGHATFCIDGEFEYNDSYSPQPGIRPFYTCFDENDEVIDIMSANGFLRRSVAGIHRSSSLTQSKTVNNARLYQSNWGRSRRWHGALPHVAKVFLGVSAYRLKSVRFTVYNCEGASFYSPAHRDMSDASQGRHVFAKPERGVYRVPTVLNYFDNSTNRHTRLNKPFDGNEYWAVSGEQGVYVPTAGQKPWVFSGAQGSANILEYDGVSAYSQIASGVYYALPTDWVDG